MNRAAISADIIASTSLTGDRRAFLDAKLRELLRELRAEFGVRKFFGRLIKGDYLECILDEPQSALRAALLIKTFVKALDIKSPSADFNCHGARVAVGIGEITALDRKKGFIDGDAIVFSGRAIQESNGHVKNGLVFRSADDGLNNSMTPLFALLDVLLARNTKTQCGILWHRLTGKTEKEISAVTGKSQSTINQHTRAAGWAAIESAVDYFEGKIK